MRRFYKIYSNRILRPYLQWKLRKTVIYKGYGMQLNIPSGVFHPHYFHSTTFLLDYLLSEHLEGKTFLELGCGSGLISLCAARAGAHVTAIDIHSKAIDNLHENAANNGIEIEMIISDLFQQLPGRQFDIIAINPPYYPRNPATEAEMAWFCGIDFEYFERLFAQLKAHVCPNGKVLMVLSEDCDMVAISRIACKHQMVLVELKRSLFMGEYQIIYSVQQ